MYKKNYRFLVMGLIFSALAVTGCSNNQKTEETVIESTANNEYESNEEAAGETVTEDDTDDEYEDYEEYEEDSEESTEETSPYVEMTYKFSEGEGWIKTRSENSLYNGYFCLDLKGNALFSVNNPDITYISPFFNGCAFVETDDVFYQIDLDGNVIKSYTISDDATVKTYAEGQIWTEEYSSGFDSAGYVYTLYNEKGEKVTEFSVEGTEPVDEINYCGQGVWRYYTRNSDGDYIYKCYCTESDKWIETDGDFPYHIYFCEDMTVLGLDNEDPDDTGYVAKMILMDKKGNLSEVGLKKQLGGNLESASGYIKDGYCILEEYGEYLISYNLSSGEFKVMDNEYTERVKMDELPDKLMFTDGCVALPLQGKDENNYVGLFDTSWNLIGEPIKCSEFDFSEGKLITVQDVTDEYGRPDQEIVLYNTKGEEMFNAYEKGYRAITPYKNGMAYVIDEEDSPIAGIFYSLNDSDMLGGEWKTIDENGERLFNTVNLDNAKAVELK